MGGGPGRCVIFAFLWIIWWNKRVVSAPSFSILVLKIWRNRLNVGRGEGNHGNHRVDRSRRRQVHRHLPSWGVAKEFKADSGPILWRKCHWTTVNSRQRWRHGARNPRGWRVGTPAGLLQRWRHRRSPHHPGVKNRHVLPYPHPREPIDGGEPINLYLTSQFTKEK